MAIFKRCDIIDTLAARSPAWGISHRDGDRFLLQSADGGPRAIVQVRSSERFKSVLFQLFLGTRFSLEKTPHMIFGRLMMRSCDLVWSAWSADIGESTEAIVSLSARVPRDSLDLALFQTICVEMRDEARAFDKELRDRLDYLRGFSPAQGKTDFPARRGDAAGEITWRNEA